ncbi:hypothetical protein LUZ60_017427 [Juncus effusus]|nr:hypothetical protein LUZ60_017427 [Juncus effusus]
MELHHLPDDYRCPISLEVMSDPVILPSGHTFDRASIQRWLATGNRTCPVTNLLLPPSPSLIPNHALRRLIHAHSPPLLLANGNGTGNGISHSPNNNNNQQLDPVELLSSSDLSTFYLNVKSSEQFRRLTLESGAVPVLLRHVASSAESESQELSLRALLRLSLEGDDTRVGLVADGAVDSLALVLSSKRATPMATAVAATVLTSLSIVDVNKCTIGAHASVFPALTWIISTGPDHRCMREATTALYELCKFPANRKRAVRAGSVPGLVNFGVNGSERAIEVLGLIAKCQEGRAEMKKIQFLTKWLVSVLKNGTMRAVENGLLVLNLICANCEEMGVEAVKEGALEVCLELIGNDKGKIGKNASLVVRTLQDLQLGYFN